MMQQLLASSKSALKVPVSHSAYHTQQSTERFLQEKSYAQAELSTNVSQPHFNTK